MTTNLPTIGTIAAALPAPVEINSSLIAAELVRYAEEAANAEGQAMRATIDSEDVAERVTAVILGINATLKNLNASRKEKTDPADTYKSTLTELYAIPKGKLEGAKSLLTGKLTGWQKAERVRREAEARDKAALAAREAAARAAAQAALGDEEGAADIMADAAQVVPVDAAVVTTGTLGGSAGLRRRPVGQVTDMRAFLAWALQAAPVIVENVEIGKRVLNDLAGIALAEKAVIPGFKAEYDESSVVR